MHQWVGTVTAEHVDPPYSARLTLLPLYLGVWQGPWNSSLERGILGKGHGPEALSVHECLRFQESSLVVAILGILLWITGWGVALQTLGAS